MQTGATGAPPNGADLAGWKAAFADDSGRRFGEIVASDAVLEGSVFAHPITGRDTIWSVLKLSGSLCDMLEFTHEVVSPDRTYLEWEARGLGLQIWGLTALTKDTQGRIIRIALHHRPLGVVTWFSAQLAERLTPIINANGVPPTDRTT
jgi:hypothetical protein